MATPLPDLTSQINSLLKDGSDLTQVLTLMRRRDLFLAETATKDRMLQLGRCPVCTLQIPCRHFQARDNVPPSLSLSMSVKRSDDEMQSKRSKPGLDVRYRSVNGNSREVYRGREKGYKKRVRLLEKLDRFREERMRKEIEKIEEEQKAKEQRFAESMEKDRRRRERNRELKEILRTKRSQDKKPADKDAHKRATDHNKDSHDAKSIDAALPRIDPPDPQIS